MPSPESLNQRLGLWEGSLCSRGETPWWCWCPLPLKVVGVDKEVVFTLLILLNLQRYVQNENDLLILRGGILERYKFWAENKLAMAMNISGWKQEGQSLARLCQGRSETRNGSKDVSSIQWETWAWLTSCTRHSRATLAHPRAVGWQIKRDIKMPK